MEEGGRSVRLGQCPWFCRFWKKSNVFQKGRRKIAPEIVATNYCMQNLRAAQALPSDQNKIVFQKAPPGIASFVGLSL